MTIEGLDMARRVMGDAILGPDEIRQAIGTDPLAGLEHDERERLRRIPFAEPDLADAARRGAMLVLRVPHADGEALTLRRLETIVPGGLDPRAHTGVGYELRDEWTIDTQTLATEDTCSAGWFLVSQAPLPDTLNQSWDAQDEILSAHASGTVPVRRTAVEVAYDTLCWYRVRGERLLGDRWDWTRSATTDGAFAALGNFGESGLRVVAYSRGVRFGTLGVCPQR